MCIYSANELSYILGGKGKWNSYLGTGLAVYHKSKHTSTL